MKVCIAGVGRSGTTSLYVLVRHMMLSTGQPARTYYEPLLWGERTWNRDYSEIGTCFASLECISVEGLAAHKRLPLFVDGAGTAPDCDYLKGLFHPEEPGAHVLLKFIRASGRLPLLRALCPEAKILYVIRDPLSVVNSLASNFSAFGEGYYPSDYERFLREIRERFDDAETQIARFEPFGIAGAQALYWYFSNRHAVEYIRSLPAAERPHVVSAEAISAPDAALARSLAGLLGFPWLDRFSGVATRPAGRITDSVCVEPELAGAMDPLLDYYEKMVGEFAPGAAVDRERLSRKFGTGVERKPVSISFENFTASRLRQTGKAAQEKATSLGHSLAESRQENERLTDRSARTEQRLEQRLRALEGELGKARESLAQSRQENQLLEKRHAHIEQRLRAVEEELGKARASVVEARASVVKAEARGKQMQAEVQELRRSWWKHWLLRKVLPKNSTLLD